MACPRVPGLASLPSQPNQSVLAAGAGYRRENREVGGLMIARAEARGAAWSDGRGRERRDESIFATAAKRRERVGYD